MVEPADLLIERSNLCGASVLVLLFLVAGWDQLGITVVPGWVVGPCQNLARRGPPPVDSLIIGLLTGCPCLCSGL